MTIGTGPGDWVELDLAEVVRQRRHLMESAVARLGPVLDATVGAHDVRHGDGISWLEVGEHRLRLELRRDGRLVVGLPDRRGRL